MKTLSHGLKYDCISNHLRQNYHCYNISIILIMQSTTTALQGKHYFTTVPLCDVSY